MLGILRSLIIHENSMGSIITFILCLAVVLVKCAFLPGLANKSVVVDQSTKMFVLESIVHL